MVYIRQICRKVIPAMAAIGFLMLPIISHAQIDKYLDKLILHNGSVIWGITEIQNDQVVVHITHGESLSLPLNQVRTIKTQKLNPEYYEPRMLGRYSLATAGVLIGKGHRNLPNEGSFTASFTSGYHLQEALALGLGLGLNYYPGVRHIPLFVNIQGEMIKGRVVPIYYLNSGWSWAFERETLLPVDRLQGGFYLEPGTGINWYLTEYSLQLRISYVRQRSKTYFEPLDLGNGNIITNTERRTLERVSITTAIRF